MFASKALAGMITISSLAPVQCAPTKQLGRRNADDDSVSLLVLPLPFRQRNRRPVPCTPSSALESGRGERISAPFTSRIEQFRNKRLMNPATMRHTIRTSEFILFLSAFFLPLIPKHRRDWKVGQKHPKSQSQGGG
jgi:hypothetical protein